MKKLFSNYWCFVLLILFACEGGGDDFSPSVSNPGGTGTAGSFASFVIVGEHLYALNGTQVKTFALSNSGEMTLTDELELGATLETVFPYGDMLLVGSQQGVFFLDRTNAAELSMISVYRHITSCDPVVASGTIAYSTLRSTRCRFGNVDQLDVIDFSDIENPTILMSYNAVEPLGLGLRGQFLFLCESGGLSMYDTADPTNLIKLDELVFDDAIAIDVIPTDQFLIVTTNKGIYNVQFADTGDMRVIGQVTAN
ncbi:MAG: hypothetical protein Roseis2KO_56400 [Roseivirga sp.]